jgi:hypothetical protein
VPDRALHARPALGLWHGAAPTAIVHVAIVEKLDGKRVDWMERASDKQYRI